MTCQETQSKVMNFINRKLDDEETLSFIEHVRSCKDCWDELEIYYIMLVGMRQLDEGEELTADFKKRLKDEIDCRYDAIETERKREYFLQISLFFLLAAGSFWLIVSLIGNYFF